MGTVFVEVAGSFNDTTKKSFSAEEGGHAMALHRGIELLNSLLPGAIIQDHELDRARDRPPVADFGKTMVTDESKTAGGGP